MKKQTILIPFIFLPAFLILVFFFMSNISNENSQSRLNNTWKLFASDQKYSSDFGNMKASDDKFELKIPESWIETFYGVPDKNSIDSNRTGIREWQFSSDGGKYESDSEASFKLSIFRLHERQSLEDLVENDKELKLVETRPYALVQPPIRLPMNELHAIQYTLDNRGWARGGEYYKKIYIEKGDSIVEIKMIGYDKKTFQRHELIFDHMLQSLHFIGT